MSQAKVIKFELEFECNSREREIVHQKRRFVSGFLKPHHPTGCCTAVVTESCWFPVNVHTLLFTGLILLTLSRLI